MTVCASCSREINVGDDCYQIARGVLGTRDFINLEGSLVCSEECLGSELAIADPEPKPTIPRRRRVP